MKKDTKYVSLIQIWGPYRRRSSERITAEKARLLLQAVDEKYLHRNLGQKADTVLEDKCLKTYNNVEFL